MTSLAAGGDRPEDNLRRILLDGARLRTGETKLAELLSAGRITGTVGAILLDLDSTAEVRRHGIGSKIALVQAARQRLSPFLPDGCVVVDSGTRDETYVVFGDTVPARVAEVAEALRTAIRDRPFPLGSSPEPVAVTTSVGYVVATEPRSAVELLLAAQEALHSAKRARDCVRTVAVVPEPIQVTLPAALAEAFAATGWNLTEATRAGFQAVEEKYGGIWHWAIDNRPGTDTLPEVDFTGAAAPEAAYFQRLLGSAVFEWAIGRHPASPSVRRSTSQPHGSLAAPYLPGEWLVADPAGRDDRPPVDRVLAARWPASGRATTETLTLQWLPSQRAQVRKLSQKRGIPVGWLLVDAIQLAVDRAAISRQSGPA